MRRLQCSAVAVMEHTRHYANDIILTLGAHAQRGCLSIYDYSRTTAYEAAYERYQQL